MTKLGEGSILEMAGLNVGDTIMCLHPSQTIPRRPAPLPAPLPAVAPRTPRTVTPRRASRPAPAAFLQLSNSGLASPQHFPYLALPRAQHDWQDDGDRPREHHQGHRRDPNPNSLHNPNPNAYPNPNPHPNTIKAIDATTPEETLTLTMASPTFKVRACHCIYTAYA